MVARIEFIGEIAEKITERGLDGRIVMSLEEDDGIGFGVENPLTDMIEGSLEMESGMACDEAGHEFEDIEIGRIGFAVLSHLVVDFHPLFGVDPSHVVGAGVQELPELGRIDKFFDLRLVGLLPEFAPHGIQHEFGQSALAGVFRDIGILEDDVFASFYRRTCSR